MIKSTIVDDELKDGKVCRFCSTIFRDNVEVMALCHQVQFLLEIGRYGWVRQTYPAILSGRFPPDPFNR